MRVAVIRGLGRRASVICTAMAEGITRCGDDVVNIKAEFYNGVDCDGAVHYGLRAQNRDAFIAYKKANFSVYIDLGYWGRREGGTNQGFHKMAVNSRHPDKYFMKVDHPSDRFNHFGLAIKPWQKNGKHILVAGMGAKAALIEGFKAGDWEDAAVKEIRRYSDRPIVYRPKPSWSDPIKIRGTTFSDRRQRLQEVFQDCYAVVSHHSNVCVEALLEGIPVFCYHGVAREMGLRELALIDSPLYPDNRLQWASNIAYTQWRPEEMATGDPWRLLKDEGIIP